MLQRTWLKNLRLAAGLTQAQLAKKLGLHRVAVTCWETGTRTPSRHAYALARILGPEVHQHLAAEAELAEPSGEDAA